MIILVGFLESNAKIVKQNMKKFWIHFGWEVLKRIQKNVAQHFGEKSWKIMGKFWRNCKEILWYICGDFKEVIFWRKYEEFWEYFGEGNSKENIKKFGNTSRFWGKLWKYFEDDIEKFYEHFGTILWKWWQNFEANMKKYWIHFEKEVLKRIRKHVANVLERHSRELWENFGRKWKEIFAIICGDFKGVTQIFWRKYEEFWEYLEKVVSKRILKKFG